MDDDVLEDIESYVDVLMELLKSGVSSEVVFPVVIGLATALGELSSLEKIGGRLAQKLRPCLAQILWRFGQRKGVRGLVASTGTIQSDMRVDWVRIVGSVTDGQIANAINN